MSSRSYSSQRTSASLGGSLGVLSLLLIIGGCCRLEGRLARDINREGLMSLRPGMTGNEVVALIGKPLYTQENYRPVPTGTPPEEALDGSESWIYGAPGVLDGGLEVSLRMDAGILAAAGAELYDLGVYRCDQVECPVILDQKALGCLRAE